jgi:hypothetical protein
MSSALGRTIRILTRLVLIVVGVYGVCGTTGFILALAGIVPLAAVKVHKFCFGVSQPELER